MGKLCAGKLVLLLIFSGLCLAQDTNFQAGPQYLMNYGSPLFFRPIVTPSLSLSTPPAANPNAPAEEGTGEPDTRVVGGFKSQAAIDRIYWGVTPTGTIASEPSLEESTSQAETPISEKSSVIELSSVEPSRPLPASIIDVGVAAVIDAQNHYGVPLGEVAAYWKANKSQAPRVYTNADIARLRSN
jgi:hypothetical protein